VQHRTCGGNNYTSSHNWALYSNLTNLSCFYGTTELAGGLKKLVLIEVEGLKSVHNILNFVKDDKYIIVVE
jgi:hypothetical protein